MIRNSNINKICSREVFKHFHEPGSAEDGSSRCIHVSKSFLVLSQLDRRKMQNKVQDCRTLVLLIGSDLASKKHENGRGGEF